MGFNSILIDSFLHLYTMRKMVVLFFLFVYLFSSTEFSELLKMNVLFEHFAEHKAENKNLSISTFLYMHYVNHGKDNKDSSQDNKLPFHSNSESSNSFIYSVIIPINSFTISSNSPNNITKKKSFYAINSCLKSSFLATIWQPPQIA